VRAARKKKFTKIAEKRQQELAIIIRKVDSWNKNTKGTLQEEGQGITQHQFFKKGVSISGNSTNSLLQNNYGR